MKGKYFPRNYTQTNERKQVSHKVLHKTGEYKQSRLLHLVPHDDVFVCCALYFSNVRWNNGTRLDAENSKFYRLSVVNRGPPVHPFYWILKLFSYFFSLFTVYKLNT